MTTQSPTGTIPTDFSVTVTDAAAARVATVRETHDLPASAGLRLGVTEGGCSGLNYDVTVADEPREDERVFEFNGTRVFVTAFGAPYIKGMTVDWITSMQESRFVFDNPNATGGCGCGVSFTVS